MTDTKLAIVTDTNSSISDTESKQLGIFLVPMPFIIDGKTFYENIDLTQEEFFKKMEQCADITTSQPSPGSLIDLWDQLLMTHDKILHIPMSSALSGSMETASMLAKNYDGKVIVVDNQRISVTLKQSVYDAIKLRDEGFSAEQIKEKLESSSADATIYVSVDTLEYLKKGGRITPAIAAIGSLFNIKPILMFKNGNLTPYKKTRGKKAALKELLKAVEYDLEHEYKGKNVTICTAFSGLSDFGDKWNSTVQSYFPDYNVWNSQLSLSIATHTGPGICGIACIVKY